MIAVVEEFDKAKSLVEVELTHLRRHGHELPERVEIGTMVEVPSLLFQLNELLERVDFLSVGSNDLMRPPTAETNHVRPAAHKELRSTRLE